MCCIMKCLLGMGIRCLKLSKRWRKGWWRKVIRSGSVGSKSRLKADGARNWIRLQVVVLGAALLVARVNEKYGITICIC